MAIKFDTDYIAALQRSAMSIENQIVKVLHASGAQCVLSHGPHLQSRGMCRIAAINILHLRSKEFGPCISVQFL